MNPLTASGRNYNHRTDILAKAAQGAEDRRGKEMSTMRTALRRAAAGAGALALAMAGAMAMGTAASAATGNINPDAEGSLTIHKYGGGSSQIDHDGRKLEETPDRPALMGVEFTIWEVAAINGTAVDLTTVAGWDALAAYMAARPVPDRDDLTLTLVSDDTTDADGVIVFDELPVGLYFVEETDPGDNPITSSSIEFLVTIPYPTGNDGDWNYNPHVYPKNTLDDEATKTVDDVDAVVEGDVVEWTVTSPVLGVAPGNTIDTFMLTDDLVDQLNYVAGTLTATLIDGDDETDLTDDFDVTYLPDAPGGTITATANSTALTALNAAPSTAYVVFSFETKVVGAGLLENTAVVNVGGTEKKTDPVTTPWGLAELTKTDAENDEPLDGAVFDVYVAGQNGVCPADPVGDPVVTRLVTGDVASGKLTTPALKAGDYCFREVVAPAGYVLPVGDAAWVPFEVKAGTTVSASVEMENVKSDGPDLPLTGAEGTLAMTIGGLLLVGAGTGAIVVSRRRHNAR